MFSSFLQIKIRNAKTFFDYQKGKEEFKQSKNTKCVFAINDKSVKRKREPEKEKSLSKKKNSDRRKCPHV